MKIKAIKSATLDAHLDGKDLGINSFVPGQFSSFLESHAEWVEREPAEKDPSYRQIIPYVIMQHLHSIEFVMMRRMPKQTEARLHGKLYVGAGGHIEEGHSIYYTALKETTEELGVPIQNLLEVGLVVSVGTEVDKVHVGVLYHALTPNRLFTSPEEALHHPQWVPINKLSTYVPEMENWSQIACQQYLFLSL